MGGDAIEVKCFIVLIKILYVLVFSIGTVMGGCGLLLKK